MPLYGEHAHTEFAENGRLVTATGADLQDPHTGGNTQQLGLKGHCVWLRYGLTAGYGERHILVGHLQKGGVVDEQVSGNSADRFQDVRILDALRPQLLHQFTAESLVAITVLRFRSHAGKSSRAEQPPGHSSIFAARIAQP